MTLPSCALPNEDVSELEKKISDYEKKNLVLEQRLIELENKQVNDIDTSSTTEKNTKKITKTQKETPYKGENYITISNPKDEVSIYEEPLEIRGIVSPNVTKINVYSTHFQMSSEVDTPKTVEQILQPFQTGDSEFNFKAMRSFENLSPGTNEYEFKAFFQDGTEKSDKIVIYFISPDKY